MFRLDGNRMKNLPAKTMAFTKIIPLAAGKLPIAASGSAITEVISAWSDYKKTVETETTKRASIDAWRDTRLADIQSKKDLLELYLKETFKERAGMIQGFFNTLDKGIEKGDNQLINDSMGAILNIANQSPLAQAKEIMLAMHDPNVQSIEI
jgi:hypothetical protein